MKDLTARFFLKEDVTKKLRKIKEETDRVTKSFGSLKDGGKGLGGTMAGTAKSLIAMSAGFLSIRGAVSTMKDFELQMNIVRAITGTTEEQFESLRKSAMDLGNSTSFTASQVGELQEAYARAGFSMGAILASSKPTLSVAKAMNAELGFTAEALGSVARMYELNIEDQKEMSRVGDVLASTAAKTNTDLTTLFESFKNAGPMAKELGLSVEETATAIGLLGNVGIKSEKAGTALKIMFQRIATDSDKLKKIGVNVYDATGSLQDLPQIIEEIAEASAKMDDRSRQDFLKNMFGQEAVGAIIKLLKQVENGSFRTLSNDLMGVTGSADRMADVMGSGLPGAWDRLTSATEGFILTLGESGLVDVMTNIANHATSMVGSLDGSISKVYEFTKAAATVFGAVKGGGLGASIGGAIGGTVGTFLFPGVGTAGGAALGANIGGAFGALAGGGAVQYGFGELEKMAETPAPAGSKNGKGEIEVTLKVESDNGSKVSASSSVSSTSGMSLNLGSINYGSLAYATQPMAPYMGYGYGR